MSRSLINPLRQSESVVADHVEITLGKRRGLLAQSIPAMLVFLSLSSITRAELTPEWVRRVPVGTSLTSGIAGIHVESDGVSYITGISGPSSNTDITTVSLAPDGSIRWSQTWGSPESGGDQARGITLSQSGILCVVGNTPGPDQFANLLILAYDADTGALLKTIRYRSGPGSSASSP